jgi:hypothetical protein
MPARFPYMPDDWTPTKAQAKLLNSGKSYNLFLGGCAVGMTEWLIAEALRACDTPDTDALLVRSFVTDLDNPGGLTPRLMRYLGRRDDVGFNDRDRRFEFANGSTLFLYATGSDSPEIRWPGMIFRFIGIDMRNQIERKDRAYLMSRLRPHHEGGRCRFCETESIHTFGLDSCVVHAGTEDNPHVDAIRLSRQLRAIDPL